MFGNYRPSTAIAVGLIAASSSLAASAQAETLSQLEARIAALEAKEQEPTQITNRHGMQLTFYGKVKVDAVMDNNYALGPTTGGLTGILASTAKDNAQKIHAYQTLFGFRAEQDTDYGKLRFNIEADFFGANNNLRIRHAYGQLGNWTLGQTWSTFSVLNEAPAVWDFNGPAGPASFRVPLIRYSQDFGTGSNITASIEEDYKTYADRPAFALAASHKMDMGSIRVAYINRKLDHGAGTVTGWGANIGATLKPWEGGLLQASYTRGEGISSIMGFSGGAGQQVTAPATQTFFDVDAAGNAVEMDGYNFAISHKVRPDLSVLAAYGSQKYDSFAGERVTDTRKLQSVHVGGKYNLMDNVALGGEVIWEKRKQFNSQTVDNTRLHLSATFEF
ncbi:DcaP family trimeric outer membrane transporter [Paracoccus alkenifer]|uniref:Porin subfamily protein n=1 Tax=Paracoccus alkenifer TaxID=65735 RepID=A0A1H6NAN4_9RHOB|nr:DcaP family trimeric outer membrane transporter [Paracoccus alkenifer]SEI11961.1 Porin subfamily protein [Paracoccus alkenifer]